MDTHVGDFNVHCDVDDNQLANAFKDVLVSLELEQHVHQATHKGGHTLDLLITRTVTDQHLVQELSVSETSLSDHFLITFKVYVKPLHASACTKMFRSIRRFNTERFAEDIALAIPAITSDIQTSQHL